MSSRPRWSWTWIVVLLGACAVFIWNSCALSDRLSYLSTIGAVGENQPANVGDLELTPNNSLPLPDQFASSYHWLAQTERTLNRGEVRVRHIDYENAPVGRTVLTPSPYRWWLAFAAWCEHLAKGAPASTLVEKAALWADPVLLGIVTLVSVVLAANYFGSLAAALVSAGMLSLFPFVTGFLPGAPDDRGLAQALAIASVLLLSVGATAAPGNEKATRRWFILAGIAGGLGLWVKVSVELPVLFGIACGGLLVPLLAPRGKSAEPVSVPFLPWRAWALAGAVTTCVASLVEYSPSELWACDLSFVHPLQGLAWLGAGVLLAQANAGRQTRANRPSLKTIVVFSVSVIAVVVVPAGLLVRNGAGFFAVDSMDAHLTRLQGGIVAQSLAACMGIRGNSTWLFLTFAPLGLLLPAVWALRNEAVARPRRVSVAITLGPVLVALAIACFKLIWWQTLDALMLVTLVAVAPTLSSQGNRSRTHLGWISWVVVSLVPGLLYVLCWERPRQGESLSRTELHDLILRDLAGWIDQHSDPASVIVLSPPSASTPLSYFGAFRGLGSASDENKDGIRAAVGIITARNLEEAKEMANRRKITHVVLLSWDPFFDDITRAAGGQVDGTLLGRLESTNLPRWLRPLAYPAPSIPGLDDQSVTVLEVVDEQDDATTEGNIALYFAEIGDLDRARLAAERLTRFSTDFGAWVARAQVAAAVHDNVELGKILTVLQERLALRVQPLVSWNRRVDLAVVLARANLNVLAKKQLMVCVNSINDDRIRSLSPLSVYRLMILCRGLDVPIPQTQHDLALHLVPVALRDRLK